MQKKKICHIIILSLVIGMLTGCQSSYSTNNELKASPATTLVIGGPWEDNKALELIAQDFHKVYPNCTVEYEYIQDYSDSLVKRLSSEDGRLDLFFHTNIQSDTDIYPYTLELFSQNEKLNLSDTYEGMIKNFTYMNPDENAPAEIYAIPVGGELRGMFVNVTLLKSVGLSVPTSRQELLDACEVLKANGYVPLQGNPGTFAQQFLYPYACNLIVNTGDYDTKYNMINQSAAGSGALFEEPMSLLYSIVESRYYNYKFVETEYGTFTDSSNEGVARDFLNISTDGNGGYRKNDDLGKVAFMPAPMTTDSTIAKFKEDYHSNIEYTFILSPVTEDGGLAYMSPAQGLAVNKNSQNIDWSLEFMNFFFSQKNNKKFAAEFDIIPNTSDAMNYIKEKFDINDSQISQLGQMTFDYSFYGIITKSLVEVSKGNNPKYMKDENTMYELSYYMDRLETRFEEQRTGSDILGDD